MSGTAPRSISFASPVPSVCGSENSSPNKLASHVGRVWWTWLLVPVVMIASSWWWSDAPLSASDYLTVFVSFIWIAPMMVALFVFQWRRIYTKTPYLKNPISGTVSPAGFTAIGATTRTEGNDVLPRSTRSGPCSAYPRVALVRHLGMC